MLRLAGSTVNVICQKFPELGRMSVHRHMHAHVDAEMKAEMVADVPLAELAERAVQEGGSLLDHFEVLRFTVEGQLRRAAAINDYSNVSSLTKRALEVNQAIGRLSGDLLSSAPVRNYMHQTNIMLGEPMMAKLESMLVQRLGPYPEALQAVLAGLQTLDASQPPLIDVSPAGALHEG